MSVYGPWETCSWWVESFLTFTWGCVSKTCLQSCVSGTKYKHFRRGSQAKFVQSNLLLMTVLICWLYLPPEDQSKMCIIICSVFFWHKNCTNLIKSSKFLQTLSTADKVPVNVSMNLRRLIWVLNVLIRYNCNCILYVPSVCPFVCLHDLECIVWHCLRGQSHHIMMLLCLLFAFCFWPFALRYVLVRVCVGFQLMFTQLLHVTLRILEVYVWCASFTLSYLKQAFHLGRWRLRIGGYHLSRRCVLVSCLSTCQLNEFSPYPATTRL